MKEADNPKSKMSLPKLFWWNHAAENSPAAEEVAIPDQLNEPSSSSPQQVLDLSLLLQKLQDGVTKLSPEEISTQVIEASLPTAAKPADTDVVPGSELADQSTNDSTNNQMEDRSSSSQSVPSIATLLNNPVEITNFIQSLQQQNYDLLERVAHLETLVNEYQATLDLQIVRAQHQHALISHQQQEHSTVQAQAKRLMEELVAANETAQRQQTLIENLSQQLEFSQNQVAQLEQDRYLERQQAEENAQQLAEATQSCEDLRARLHRQQQYTLQFKAALEKSLALSGSSQTLESLSGDLQEDLHGEANPDIPTTQVFLPKATSIQPWSSVPALFGEDTAPIVDTKDAGAATDPVSDWYWFSELTRDDASEHSATELEAVIDVLALNPDEEPDLTPSNNLPSFLISKTPAAKSTEPVQLMQFGFVDDQQEETNVCQEAIVEAELPGEESNGSDDAEISALLETLHEPADLIHSLAIPAEELVLTETTLALDEETEGEEAEEAIAPLPASEDDVLDLMAVDDSQPYPANLDEIDLNVAQLTTSETDQFEPIQLEPVQMDEQPSGEEIDLWQEMSRVVEAPPEVAISSSSIFHSPHAATVLATSQSTPDYSVNGLADNPWDSRPAEPTACQPESDRASVQPQQAPEPTIELAQEAVQSFSPLLDNVDELADDRSQPTPTHDFPTNASVSANSATDTPSTKLETEPEAKPKLEIEPLLPQYSNFRPYFRSGFLRSQRSGPVQPYSPDIATIRSPLAAAPPSPIVYPDRPAKKLTSLAAVKLPTFPRSAR